MRSSTAATAATTVSALVLALLQNVVLALLDGLGREKVGKLVAFGVLFCPLPNSVKHVSVNLDTFVAGGRVMESADHIIDHFVYRNASVLPGIENATTWMW